MTDERIKPADGIVVDKDGNRVDTRPKMRDLVKRHRAAARALSRRQGNAAAAQCRFHDETADRIEELEAENAKLRAAIKFAIAQFEHDEFRSVIEQGLEDVLAELDDETD